MGEEEEEMMMKNKYGCWGLSLSLSPPITQLDHKPVCKREPQFLTDTHSPKMHKPNKVLMMSPKIMGVEMKPTPLVIDLEEVELAKVSSPNSTLSTTSIKRFDGERNSNSDDDDGGNSGGTTDQDGCMQRGERKKLRLSKEQIAVLEQAFREHTTLNTKQKLGLAKQVNLRPRQVEVWFQNRRARTKLKQTEIDCENLKRFCENLLEENRKLQRELHDIRVLKTTSSSSSSPDHNLHHHHHHHSLMQPSNNALCPSCKNVSPARQSPKLRGVSSTSRNSAYRAPPVEWCSSLKFLECSP